MDWYTYRLAARSRKGLLPLGNTPCSKIILISPNSTIDLITNLKYQNLKLLSLIACQGLHEVPNYLLEIESVYIIQYGSDLIIDIN